MKKTYKVELTEEEARVIGERRWQEGIKRQAYKWLLIMLGIAVVFTGLTITFADILSIVFAILTVLAVGIGFLLACRYDRLATKAGKAFAQSLKKGND